MRANGLEEAYVRLTVTAGAGELGSAVAAADSTGAVVGAAGTAVSTVVVAVSVAASTTGGGLRLISLTKTPFGWLPQEGRALWRHEQT